MIRRSLKDVERMVKGSNLKKEYEEFYIEGVSTDSRKIKKGQLFIPLIGENFDGHKFIEKAIENGAIATLWNKDEPIPPLDFPFVLVEDTLSALQRLAKGYRKELNLKIIGITGSNGKTSTKDIVASLLSVKYKTKKTIGNFNNHIGVPLTILDLDEDTEMAIVEMGTDNFGQISFLANLAKPDVAIITNIGEAHLEGLITRENIAKAKLEILEGLNPNGLFVYWGDDSILKKEIQSLDIKQKVLTYGTYESNDYQCELATVDEDGISFKLKKPSAQNYSLPMLGKHNMYNATAAIMVARHFNIPFESIQDALYNINKTGMRNEMVYGKGFAILNDSYKSNPSSVLAALDTFYSIEGYKEKIVALGDMLGLGEDEIKMHEEIGLNIDPKKVDYLFTIGPLAKHIGKTAKTVLGKDKVTSFTNKPELIEGLKKVIKAKSLILVKASRSLELEEVVDALKEQVKFY